MKNIKIICEACALIMFVTMLVFILPAHGAEPKTCEEDEASGRCLTPQEIKVPIIVSTKILARKNNHWPLARANGYCQGYRDTLEGVIKSRDYYRELIKSIISDKNTIVDQTINTMLKGIDSYIVPPMVTNIVIYKDGVAFECPSGKIIKMKNSSKTQVSQ